MILAVVLVAMIPATLRGFVGSDDWGWVKDVPRRNTLETIFDPYLVTANEGPSTYYIPVQSIIYLVYVRLGGEKVGALLLHWTLLLAHIANAYLLWGLMRTLWRPSQGTLASETVPPARDLVALLGATFFVLHPANLWTMAWIGAGVSHTLLLLLGLLCCQVWLRYQRAQESGGALQLGRYLLVLAMAVVASLLKETASMIPMALAGMTLAATLERGARPSMRQLGLRALELIPFGGLAVFIFVMQRLKYPVGHLSQHWGGVSLGGRVPLRALDLLSQLVLPTRQPEMVKLVLASVLAGVLCHAILGIGRRRVAVGVLACYGFLLVLPFAIHNFRPPETLSRYLYLPSAALLPGLALSLGPLLEGGGRRGRMVLWGAGLLSLVWLVSGAATYWVKGA